MLNIVLVDPQIPQNTGNIARLCSCTGSSLFLIGTLGFFLSDKYLKRAGLDYWDNLNIKYYDTFDLLKKEFPDNNYYYASTKAKKYYTEIIYTPNDFLVFGSETKGLPESLIFDNPNNAVKIPMISDKRSLNLANSVSIVLYEAIRQTNLIN
jgi:tRNA (cytidine/uridine-2'-O-)-methyltransferase